MARIRVGPLINRGLGKLGDRVFSTRRGTKLFRQDLGQDYPDTDKQQRIKSYTEAAGHLWNGFQRWIFGSSEKSDLTYDQIWGYLLRNTVRTAYSGFMANYLSQVNADSDYYEDILLNKGNTPSSPPTFILLRPTPDTLLFRVRTPHWFPPGFKYSFILLTVLGPFRDDGLLPVTDADVVYCPYLAPDNNRTYDLYLDRPAELPAWHTYSMASISMLYVRDDRNWPQRPGRILPTYDSKLTAPTQWALIF